MIGFSARSICLKFHSGAAQLEPANRFEERVFDPLIGAFTANCAECFSERGIDSARVFGFWILSTDSWYEFDPAFSRRLLSNEGNGSKQTPSAGENNNPDKTITRLIRERAFIEAGQLYSSITMLFD